MSGAVRQCAPCEIKINFDLVNLDGSTATSLTEGQERRLMALQHANELSLWPGGVFLIFRLDARDYSEAWAEKTRLKICRIINPRAPQPQQPRQRRAPLFEARL